VDGYTLVFAGELLVAGCMGDRFGRRRALVFGLVTFRLGSLSASMADSSAGLIGSRALMGVGAAAARARAASPRRRPAELAEPAPA
jgi:MFS family permease